MSVALHKVGQPWRVRKHAHWHAHLAHHWSPHLRAWLSCRQSLTARLVQHSHQFRVQKMSQGIVTCLPEDAEKLALSDSRKVHQREVILRCDGVACVFGHTVVPLHATSQQWPLFASLGERSLGSILFSDPLVQRGALSYARLPMQHPLMRRIREYLSQEQPDLLNLTELPTRRSIFWRRGSALLVTEVFLPSVSGLTKRMK